MIIKVKVIPNSSKETVEGQKDGTYRVYVHEKPVKGKASEAVKRVLAEHFRQPLSSIEIKPTSSRNKIVKIKDNNTY